MAGRARRRRDRAGGGAGRTSPISWHAGDAEAIADGADADGNPVTGLVALLRRRTPEPTARWLHRGLTSQDVIDTALMLCVRDVLARIGNELASQVRTLSRLAETHRDTPMVARTLTQAALPSTVGVKVAHWLSGVYRSRRAGGGATGLAARAGRRRGGHAGRSHRADRVGRRRDRAQ